MSALVVAVTDSVFPNLDAAHTAFYSEESLLELQTEAAEEVVRVLQGQAPRNLVNPEVLKPAVTT